MPTPPFVFILVLFVCWRASVMTRPRHGERFVIIFEFELPPGEFIFSLASVGGQWLTTHALANEDHEMFSV